MRLPRALGIAGPEKVVAAAAALACGCTRGGAGQTAHRGMTFVRIDR